MFSEEKLLGQLAALSLDAADYNNKQQYKQRLSTTTVNNNLKTMEVPSLWSLDS
jgi:hypothetical protein